MRSEAGYRKPKGSLFTDSIGTTAPQLLILRKSWGRNGRRQAQYERCGGGRDFTNNIPWQLQPEH
ncbi:hypothetical protein, partial [Corynebacterium amycolatum]